MVLKVRIHECVQIHKNINISFNEEAVCVRVTKIEKDLLTKCKKYHNMGLPFPSEDRHSVSTKVDRGWDSHETPISLKWICELCEGVNYFLYPKKTITSIIWA